MSKKVLIITHSKDDETVLPIINALKEREAEPIRFNVDEFPGKLQLNVSFIDGAWQKSIFDGAQWHDVQEITSIWMRRADRVAAHLAHILEGKYLAAAKQEAQRAFNNFIYALDCFKLNDPSKQMHFYSKERQLELASQLGFRIPQTCISNSPAQLKQLLEKYPEGIVAKPLTSYFVDYDEVPQATLFSQVYRAEDLGDLEGLEFSPMIFQEPIPKKVELRVPVVGDKVWAYSIDSQSEEGAKDDWRKEGLRMINQWKPYSLPEEVKERILKFVKSLGCTYGSLDLIVTPEEEYVFLEINSDGEFFWLDKASDYQIAAALAEELTK